jgi:hypothetical protein
MAFPVITRSASFKVTSSVWNADVVQNLNDLRAGKIAVPFAVAGAVPYALSASALTASSQFTFDGSSLLIPSSVRVGAGIRNLVANGATYLLGGTSVADGAYVDAYGNSHATIPGRLILRPGNAGSGDIYLYRRDGNIAAYIDGSTGNLTLVNAGVKFPTTQIASTDANVLDDYEEGSWNPTLTGVSGLSGQTYGSRDGKYVKIGAWVFVEGLIGLSALGTLTGNAAIGGLPFMFAGSGGIAAVGYWSGLLTSLVQMSLLYSAGNAIALLYGATAAAAGLSALTSAAFGNTTDLRFAFFYRTTA